MGLFGATCRLVRKVARVTRVAAALVQRTIWGELKVTVDCSQMKPSGVARAGQDIGEVRERSAG